MAIPEWADQALSDELPILRDRGEGQQLEFKEKYPENGHVLSQEIAAFASSNAGVILIGVADDGSLIGIPDADKTKVRDQLSQRLEGICAGQVKPAITPVVKFGIEGDKVVLAIEVPRGTQPIYYNKHTPYVRHLSSSRPAEPHEVVDRVEAWLATRLAAVTGPPGPDNAEAPVDGFLTSLLSPLIDVLIYGDEVEERNTNPWLDLLKSQLGSTARSLRALAAEPRSIELDLEQKILDIADLLSKVSTYQHTLGRESWREFTDLIEEAVQRGRALKSEIDTLPLSAAAQNEVRRYVGKFARELSDLDRRADDLANAGDMDELQSEASRLGEMFLRLGYYDLHFLGENFSERLRSAGRKLHLIETDRLYMDGGQSVRKITGAVHSLAEEINALVRPLG